MLCPKLIFTLTLTLTAPTAALAGKTADGCTYQVVNGQYLTSCSKAGDNAAPAAASMPASIAPTPPPMSYAAVPVRQDANAPRPSVVQAETIAVQIQAPSQNLAIERVERKSFEKIEHDGRDRPMIDGIYAGLNLGSTSVSAANAGGAMGLGVSVGSNVDDTLGVELGYSYTNLDLNLNLDNRGFADPTTAVSAYPRTSDAKLRSHLFSGEVQGHLTNTYSRFRPYLGAGLGWKSSTVEENPNPQNFLQPEGGKLSQSSFGGIAAAGTKFRVSQAIHVGVAFRYFFPIARQESQLERPPTTGYGIVQGDGQPGADTRLTKADSALTGSSQYQIMGGLSYVF